MPAPHTMQGQARAHAACGTCAKLALPMDLGVVHIGPKDQPYMPDPLGRASSVRSPHAALASDWLCAWNLTHSAYRPHIPHAAYQTGVGMCCIVHRTRASMCTASSTYEQSRVHSACSAHTSPAQQAGSHK